MEAETVDSFSGGHENTPRWIKMTANIYQDLQRRWKADINALLRARNKFQKYLNKVWDFSRLIKKKPDENKIGYIEGTVANWCLISI